MESEGKGRKEIKSVPVRWKDTWKRRETHKWRPSPQEVSGLRPVLGTSALRSHTGNKSPWLVRGQVGSTGGLRRLDSPDECAHPCLRRNRGETRLELHPTLGPSPRLPRQTPQPEPSPIPSLASRYRYTREQGPLWRRATVAAETQSGV